MKTFLSRLKVGNVVTAEVVEATGGNDFIVNFRGDLVRIANHTGKKLVPGQTVSLVVTGIQPFSFRLQGSPGHGLDRHI